MSNSQKFIFFICFVFTLLHFSSAAAQVDIKVAPVAFLPDQPQPGIHSLIFDIAAKGRSQLNNVSAFQGALVLDSLFNSLGPDVSFDSSLFPAASYVRTCDYRPESGRVRFVYTRQNGPYATIGTNWTVITRITVRYASERIDLSLDWFNGEPDYYVSHEDLDDITGDKQTVPDLFATSTYVYQFPFAGMYPVSLPGTQPDMRLAALFPLVTTCYGYKNGSYMTVDTLEVAYGYWLYVPADITPLTLSLQLIPVHQYSRFLPQSGWHLLGSAARSSPVFTVPNDRGLYPLQEYDIYAQEYVNANEIAPKKACWLAVTDRCDAHVGHDLSLPGKFLAKIDNTSGNPPPPPAITSFNTRPENFETFGLFQNYPNPFNQYTTISWQTPETTRLTVTVYNTRGQMVKKIFDGYCKTGYYQQKWDGKDDFYQPVGAGIYIVRFETEKILFCRKILYLK